MTGDLAGTSGAHSGDRVQAARAALDDAQRQMEAVAADSGALTQLSAVLESAIARARVLAEYYEGGWAEDVEVILAGDPTGITPPAANQDAVWEALSDHDDRIRLILGLVAGYLTRDLR